MAVLTVDGVLAPKMNLMMEISGGTSVQMLSDDFAESVDRPDVRAIVFDLSTPGGSVSLISSLAGQIFNARGQKPIVAVVNTEANSGGYWLAAACDQIIMTEDTAMAGSIGVRMVHRDTSKAQEKAGIKTTHIYSGIYKAMGNSDQPLSDPAAAYLQDQTDYLYSLFVEAVAKYRGVSAEQALANMAEGQIFIGQRAIDAGLVDGIESFDSIINRLSAKKPAYFRGLSMPTVAAVNEALPGVENNAGLQPNAIEAAVVAQSALAAQSATADLIAQARDAGHGKGVSDERTRILAILALAPAGFESNAREAIDAGASAGDFSLAVLKEIKDRGVTLAAMRADSPGVPFAAQPNGGGGASAPKLVSTADIYASRRQSR